LEQQMSTVNLSKEQQQLITRTLDEVLVQRSTLAEISGGGSLSRGEPSCPAEEPFRSAHRYFDEWDPVVRELSDQKPPPPPPPTVSQLGPFHTGPIVFGGGVPVGGWSSLSVWSNGAYNFNGHFHDSGATSYDVQIGWAIADGAGTVYTFTKSGHVAGTFEPGSRDFDWNDSGTNPALAAGFNTLAQRYRWQWTARANWDVGALIDSVLAAIRAAGFVVSTVKAIV
jgi:hypothetical protein